MDRFEKKDSNENSGSSKSKNKGKKCFFSIEKGHFKIGCLV